MGDTMNSRATVKSALAGAIVAVVLAGCAAAATPAPTPSPKATPAASAPAAATQAPTATIPAVQTSVKVQLDYVLRGNHAMFFVGKEKGIFARHGINVTSIEPGKGSGPSMQLVGADQADFGFGDLPTLVIARSQAVPVVGLVAVNQKSPISFCSLKNKHPLTKVADLVGLRMGVQASGSTYIFYQAVVSANGVDRSKITELPVTAPYENYLLQGQVDVISCYIDAEVPELKAKAKDQGELSILLGSTIGYDVFGSGMYTSERMIKTKPEVVKQFTAAYLEAFQWVLDHPKEAADITAASSPLTKDKAPIFVEQLQADIDFTFTDASTKLHGLGFMDPAKWIKTKDVLAAQKLLKTDVSVWSLYDNTFQAAAFSGK